MTTDPAVLFFEAVAEEFIYQHKLHHLNQTEFLNGDTERRWALHVAKAILLLRQKSGLDWFDQWEQPCKLLTNRGRIDLELSVAGEKWGIELKCSTAGGGVRNDSLRRLLEGYQRRFILTASPTMAKQGPCDGRSLVKLLNDRNSWENHLLKVESQEYAISDLAQYERIHEKWRNKKYPLPPGAIAHLVGERPIDSFAAVGLIEITI